MFLVIPIASRENARAGPFGTALRPVAEANWRDVTSNFSDGRHLVKWQNDFFSESASRKLALLLIALVEFFAGDVSVTVAAVVPGVGGDDDDEAGSYYFPGR